MFVHVPMAWRENAVIATKAAALLRATRSKFTTRIYKFYDWKLCTRRACANVLRYSAELKRVSADRHERHRHRHRNK